MLTDLVLVATLISVSLTVDAIIGNQTFQNRRCYVYFTLALDKVETGYNLLIELNKMLNCSYSHWFPCGELFFVG